jgi:PPP family 3-phenylpropionic acid transporter
VSTLLRFAVLYTLMYAAFGVSSPFLPALLESRGLAPEQLGVLLAAATGIRLVSGPGGGRVADRTGALRAVLLVCAVLAALAALGLVTVTGFAALLLIGVLHAAALAPITTLADALALGAATGRAARPRFEYGWVRGTGSAVFVIGTLVSGQIVGSWGLGAILVAQAALLGATAAAVMAVPESRASTAPTAAGPARAGVGELLRAPLFRQVMLVSALVLGSHAMHDSFAVIRWRAAGVTPGLASVLWSLSVAAEVVVFFLVGPALVGRLGAPGTVALAAAAGAVRWVVMAFSTDVIALALVQPLHGLTFAALHLACMRLIPAAAPPHLAATAQAMYALGAGATTALLTLVSGRLYADLGSHGFLAMALLCLAALPVSSGLRVARP